MTRKRYDFPYHRTLPPHLCDLPNEMQEQARRCYRLFRQNPQHPSLRFRQVHLNPAVYSVRVGIHYRAVAVRDDQAQDEETWVWFWIGPHAEYDHLLAQL